MIVQWTNRGLSDVVRLHEFLTPVNAAAAAKVVRSLTTAAGKIARNPRIGEKLEQYDPSEVRRLIAGHYELRYEIREQTIYVLRIWHTREDR